MNLKKYFIIILLFIVFSFQNIHAFDFSNMWMHPEIADKYSLFLDIGKSINFDDLKEINKYKIDFYYIDIRFDFMPPLPLPFFLGFYLITPNPNLKNLGLRTGYHFDFNNPLIDVYLLYNLELGWLRNDVLLLYNDTPVDQYYYDFRFGFRYFFSPRSRFGLCVESGFQFKSVVILLTIKIN